MLPLDRQFGSQEHMTATCGGCGQPFRVRSTDFDEFCPHCADTIIIRRELREIKEMVAQILKIVRLE